MANGISTRLTPAEGRKFGLTLGVAFAFLAAVLWWRGHDNLAAVAGGLGLLLFVAGLLIPQRLGPVQRGWLRFGHMLSRITTPLVMGMLYLLVFTPIGVVMRIAGRNALTRRAENNSYWVKRPAARGKAAMQRQF